MNYSYVLEKRDYGRIDKLNTLNNAGTFWNEARKFTKNVMSDHAINRWLCLSEIRYNELMPEAVKE